VKNQVQKILSGAICRPTANPAPLPLPFQNTGPQCQCKIAAEDEKRGSLRFQKGILRLHVWPLLASAPISSNFWRLPRTLIPPFVVGGDANNGQGNPNIKTDALARQINLSHNPVERLPQRGNIFVAIVRQHMYRPSGPVSKNG